ncbi:MAG: FAD-dependent oxidoreductase [Blautia sp.]
MNKYPHIFTPGKIGQVEVRNRTVMPSMGTNMSDHGYVNDAIVNHYTARARGGIGLIMVEVTCVDTPLGMNTLNMLVADDDKYIPGLTRLAAAIHEAGAKCFLQLSHTGRGARRKNIKTQPVGPSAVAMPFSYMMGFGNEEPRELTVEEIQTIEDKYAAAAFRAKQAGFDGVELHACGYYMGQQFLSSTANIRTDEYGGSPENRSRFYSNVITKIRKNCGWEFGLVVKQAVMEAGAEGGITLEEGMYYANKFLTVGADGIEVMGGSWKTNPDLEDIPSTADKPGRMLGLCGLVKKSVLSMPGEKRNPVFIGGGRSYLPDMVEEALSAGQCDFVFMGHGVLSEPNLVNLIAEDRYDEARPCIGCSVCTDDQLTYERHIRCSNNAVLGHGDNDYTMPPAKTPKKVLVVGAGIAGMEAARVAAKRGHMVTLVEKSDHIGGQLDYAVAPPYKDNLKQLYPYFEKQLQINHVNVIFHTEVDEKYILEQKPDVVIWAAGVLPAVLPIKGFDKPIVSSAKEALAGKPLGQKVVIIGGGVVGCETAELLLQQGKEVTVVEMLDSLAGKMAATTRSILMGHLKGLGLKTYMECTCKEITDTGIVLEDKAKNEVALTCDDVLISIGDKPNNKLCDSIRAKVPEFYNIGDSSQPDSFAASTSAGYYTALSL